MTPADLKRRRESLGLSQPQLGALLNQNAESGRVMVVRWESGAVAITPMRAVWLDQELRRLESEAAAT